MDRSWMRVNRLSDEYEHGVMEFLEFAESNAKKDLPPPKSNAEDSHPTLFFCPCVRCANKEPKLSKKKIIDHLICEGICQNYTQWIWHSEVVENSNVSQRDNAINGWTDKSFTKLLELLTQMLPKGNVLPSRYYEAKKILCPMGLEYEKIHVCPNDCILYRKEFKRLFANANDAKNLRWHAEERKCDGQIRHVVDSLQWKKIDSLFLGKESRNLRLGLSTDGMNPFGTLNTNHTSWPVLLMIYNLSPRLCMKRKYVMLSMMISGPKQPGSDIDVYLSPLIDDLKVLWEEGVDVFDAHSGEQFNMRAMLFCTINDFPAYGNLSGYKVKGHKACPICEKDTCYHQLEKGKKTVYLGHRKFLNRYHPYRRLRKAFNGEQEYGVAPKPLTEEEVYQRQQGITVVFGKYQKRPIVKNIWKKRSVFFDLPYWSSLEVRHCIDVMHVEKNVCDSVIGTLLNIQGKTKDGINARLDLGLMGIREELTPQYIGNKRYFPPACYTLSKKEKLSFCECLENIKVPHVAIRGILPNNVRKTITRLRLFFNAICCKAIDPLKLEDLENEAAVILCQLEMFFPPSFFDIMVHLIVHLVREIRLYGPIFLRWMYPIEQYMKIRKGYTKNPHRPEASIIERYITEEEIEFCSNYLSEVNAVGVPKSPHDGRCEGVDEVQPYLSVHKSIIKKKYPKMSERGLLKEHNKSFSEWFKEKIAGDDSASKTIKWLSYEPKCNIITWSGYDINKTSFYTKEKDDRNTTQNSGVMIVAESMHFSSAKDKNSVMASTPYFRVIEEIWEDDYVGFKVPVFKCKWVDINSGVRIEEFGVTLVDLSKLAYTDEPFIMASQAKQVFYVTDPCNKRWSVVLQGKVHGSDENQDANLDISETPPFSTNVPTFIEEDVEDDVHVIHIDHEEGIWEN
ncbi:uncharacterized protein LOC131619068 [Vicia villosa]|uniref:uncharacterized protein LOC131619068 n=1 Tax=Vicia villosa TaxID=3911 RepID=UPI00273B3CD7|nr:uncharacterized protein LOC131619068 [Vicia villosa]